MRRRHGIRLSLAGVTTPLNLPEGKNIPRRTGADGMNRRPKVSIRSVYVSCVRLVSRTYLFAVLFRHLAGENVNFRDEDTPDPPFEQMD